MNQESNIDQQNDPNTTVHQESAPDPWAGLSGVRTRLRPDLHVTRTINRSEPIYILYDPVSFQSQRLSRDDYEILARINDEQTLASVFASCVRAGMLDNESETKFYQFVQRLSKLNVLVLQTNDTASLYETYRKSKAQSTKNQWLSFLFITIPLSNPDKFLDRYVDRFRFLFSKPALAIWAASLLLALTLLHSRWSEFWEPLNSILAVKNLFFMFIAFIGLKVWHELGHGFACKHFGGRVPEMGCKLIAGMPLAYVDASSAWSFPVRRNRVIVMLGGMYFETIIAIPAVFVWAGTPHSPLGSFAYQLTCMAGIATLLFNINPLMKFDGYFIASDLLGVPNLRGRASHEVSRLCKKYLVGLDANVSFAQSNRDRIILVTYGIAATLYGCFLMVAISGIVATKLYVLGIILVTGQIGWMIYAKLSGIRSFLLEAEETAHVRKRARIVHHGLFIALPLLLFIFPMPGGHYVPGVVTSQTETIVRVATPGVLRSIVNPVPAEVKAGDRLAVLTSRDAESEMTTVSLAAERSFREAQLFRQTDLSESTRLMEFAVSSAHARDLSIAKHAKLETRVQHDGKLANIVEPEKIGTYMNVGDPIATIVNGDAVIRCWLNEEQLSTSKLEIGRRADVRLDQESSTTYRGQIESIAAANQEDFPDVSLTTMAEGNLAYDPETRQTAERVFRVLVRVPQLDGKQTLHQTRASVRLSRRYESIGRWCVRHVGQFCNRLFADAHQEKS